MQTTVTDSGICGSNRTEKARTAQPSRQEESAYNSEFVEKIRRAEQQPSKKLDLEKYGISI